MQNYLNMHQYVWKNVYLPSLSPTIGRSLSLPNLKEIAVKKIYKNDFKIYNVTVLQVWKHQFYTHIAYDGG